MSLEVDIPVIKEIRGAGMIVAREMNTAENQATLQSTEMRGEVEGAEVKAGEIEMIMEPGGEIMMEGETGVEAGAERTTGGEAGTRMTRGRAETGTRRGGASRGRGGGAGVGRGETLKTGQVVGGAGMRREGEEEEAGTGTGEEEEEVMRRDRGAERSENRRGRSK